MRLFNVCSSKVFEKEGIKKRKYYKVGEVSIDESTGSMFMFLYHNPDVRYYLLDKEEQLVSIDVETGKVILE